MELSVDQQALEGVATAIRYEEDGRQLRKDLMIELRSAVAPALPQISSGLMGMTAGGLDVSPGLRTSVLSKLRVSTRLSGDRAGVRVSIGRKGMPRGFDLAARRLNAAGGWRHPIPRRPRKDGSLPEQQWVHQLGKPGYFDDPLQARRDEYRQAAIEAVQKMSQRIAARRTGA